MDSIARAHSTVVSLNGLGLVLTALALASPFTATAVAAEDKPNIVVILADDLGYAEVNCQQPQEIPTPRINSIGKSGVCCTNGYVTCPVCSPTRAGLLSGRYQQRFGHEFNPGPQAGPNFGLPLTEGTLADALKSGGYKTGLVGKWHLGNRPEYLPQKRGFDEFYGFLGGAHPYLPPGAEAGAAQDASAAAETDAAPAKAGDSPRAR